MKKKLNHSQPQEEEAVANPVEEDQVFLCSAPAPLAVNGGSYCGCQLAIGHEGPHEVIISWAN